ncbi:hypothetical protein PybrP1_011729 [[Pythium] brassicae (nom. inval.)]|nr:hypothetical protein PybrP1_011729 [[Pythium] brassicae (nom. inval.)]
MLRLAGTFAAAALLVTRVAGTEFKARDEVFVVANTVRPYANPTETYEFYKLPFCKPKERNWDDHELGELLTGSRKVLTDYKLYFGVDQSYAQLCRLPMTPEVVQAFRDAMYVDDIQLHGQVGRVVQQGMAQTHYFLNTHLHFDVAYNNEGIDVKGESRLVAANVTMVSPDPELASQYALSAENVAAHPDAVFTYSVAWHYRADLDYDDRNARAGEFADDLELHWIAVINSFILVMMLTSFLAIVMLRILRRDFSRYLDTESDGGGAGLDDDAGWKLVHADVFRVPARLSLFCALNGAGAQLFVMLFAVLSSSLVGFVKPNKRGSVMTALIVLYALTAGVGGYHAARLYRQLGGQRWVWNILLSVLVIPGPLLLVFSFLNSVAIWNDSSAALPFGTILIVLAIFALVALPLAVVGGIAGRNTAGDFGAPCRTNKIPREVPAVPWYRRPGVLTLAAGCLPFSAVYIELHHILAAVWGHSIYQLFGILLLASLMLVVVTAFTAVSLTYIQLSSEDHRWWWRAYLAGGVTGLFVLLYSVWYYKRATAMTGFFQAAFYFGYTGMMAYCFFVLLGFVGFQASLVFVRKIYRTIKVE